VSDEERRALDETCRLNDYDRKFDAVRAAVARHVPVREPVVGLDVVLRDALASSWEQLCRHHWQRAARQEGSVRDRALRSARRTWGAVPEPLRSVVPTRWRAALKQRLLLD
jgi:hypothetical protein